MGHQQEKQGDKVYGYQGPAYREKADRVIVLEHTASMPIHSWIWAVSQSVGVGNDFSKTPGDGERVGWRESTISGNEREQGIFLWVGNGCYEDLHWEGSGRSQVRPTKATWQSRNVAAQFILSDGRTQKFVEQCWNKLFQKYNTLHVKHGLCAGVCVWCVYGGCTLVESNWSGEYSCPSNPGHHWLSYKSLN